MCIRDRAYLIEQAGGYASDGRRSILDIVPTCLLYTSYYPTLALWPDFGREDLYEAIVAFNQRDRRYGLVRDSTSP